MCAANKVIIIWPTLILKSKNNHIFKKKKVLLSPLSIKDLETFAINFKDRNYIVSKLQTSY